MTRQKHGLIRHTTAAKHLRPPSWQSLLQPLRKLEVPWVKTLPDRGDPVAEELVYLTNGLRVQSGLPPLTPHPKLILSAYNHAHSMAQTGRFAHKLDSYNAYDRIKAAGLLFSSWGENIAHYGPHSGLSEHTLADRIFSLWADSPSHYRLLVFPAVTHIGIATVAAPDRSDDLYAVQNLAAPTTIRDLALRVVGSAFHL